MRVIVLGARGFIGSNLVEKLKRDGHEVIQYGRQQSDDKHYDMGQLDIVDSIINCAGQTRFASQMPEDNLLFVNEWIDWAQLKGLSRFIQIGSSSEVGAVEGLRSESSFCSPTNLYDSTKLAATNLCLGYAHQYDLNISIIRPFTVYGKADKPRMMLPSLWRAWVEEKEFTIYPGGHDWLYIEDLIDGIIAVLNAPRSAVKGQIFNMGTGICTSNARIVELFNAGVSGGGVKVKYSPLKYHPYDVTDWRADITKAREVLGWSPKISIEEGIKRFIDEEWFKEEKSVGL